MSITPASEICVAVMFFLLQTGNYKMQSVVVFSGVMFLVICMKIYWFV
jgi:hypothetical protein